MVRALTFDVGNTLILASPRFWLLPLLEARGLRPRGDVRKAALEAFRFYEENHLKARDLETALGLWREFHRRLLVGMGPRTTPRPFPESSWPAGRTPPPGPSSPGRRPP